MARVKGGKTSLKTRKHILKYTKGFRWGRKSKVRAAKTALLHAWSYAYRDRKNKKRMARRLWSIQINAACRQLGLTYSKLIFGLKNKKIELDRKVLSQICQEEPETFKKIVELIK